MFRSFIPYRFQLRISAWVLLLSRSARNLVKRPKGLSSRGLSHSRNRGSRLSWTARQSFATLPQLKPEGEKPKRHKLRS